MKRASEFFTKSRLVNCSWRKAHTEEPDVTERQLPGEKIQVGICWRSRKKVASINNTAKILLPKVRQDQIKKI